MTQRKRNLNKLVKLNRGGKNMKLNPEIKLLKKEVRFLRKTIERQNNELGNLGIT